MSARTLRRLGWALLGLSALALAALLAYQTPFIQEKLGWRVSELRARLQYALAPPDQAVFTPDPTLSSAVAATFAALTPSPTASPTVEPTAPTGPTATATVTPEPISESTILDGVIYVDQHNRWNYCGPANLTMALKFWGWPGNRDDVARVVKPGVQDPDLSFIQQGRWDKNVMPYEMANFVTDQTEFSVLVRHGGEVDVLKRLIAAGFPVLVEKGYYEADYTGKVAWLGHYLYTTGYSDTSGEFIVQDAYLEPGQDRHVNYAEYIEGWRSFNYLFMVIYPPDQQQTVYQALGPWGDPAWSDQHALEIAESETQMLTGIDRFFAWFNKGSSLVELLRYPEAAAAYDTAFDQYAGLTDDDTQRPYRIMWYQTGPYWAYYYSGRYQDVINLANNTLNETIAEPTLEESLYWRGLAREAVGDVNGAVADLAEAVRLNPNFAAGQSQLNRILGG
ncbi:MAG: C39 family peptidase [Anaerolineales bacterium]